MFKQKKNLSIVLTQQELNTMSHSNSQTFEHAIKKLTEEVDKLNHICNLNDITNNNVLLTLQHQTLQNSESITIMINLINNLTNMIEHTRKDLRELQQNKK